MAKRPNHSRTWLEIAVANAGTRQGLRGMSWALSWAMARAVIGHDPTVEEVARWWKENERTAYREQVAFRLAFPDFDTPAPIFDTPEAAALVQEFVSSISTRGAVKKVRALEEATIRIGYMSANAEE